MKWIGKCYTYQSVVNTNSTYSIIKAIRTVFATLEMQLYNHISLTYKLNRNAGDSGSLI